MPYAADADASVDGSAGGAVSVGHKVSAVTTKRTTTNIPNKKKVSSARIRRSGAPELSEWVNECEIYVCESFHSLWHSQLPVARCQLCLYLTFAQRPLAAFVSLSCDGSMQQVCLLAGLKLKARWKCEFLKQFWIFILVRYILFLNYYWIIVVYCLVFFPCKYIFQISYIHLK